MNKDNTWTECTKVLPKDNIVVETKIDDKAGCRNQTTLKKVGNLWFLPNGSMYVYYEPTHWRKIDNQ